MYEAFALGEFDKDEYLDRKTALVKQRDDAAEQINRMEISLENRGTDGNLHNRFVDCFRQYAEIQELNREIITDVLDTLFIYPGGRIEIVWNYEFAYYKKLIALRKELDIISDGSFEPIENVPDKIFAYRRKLETRSYLSM